MQKVNLKGDILTDELFQEMCLAYLKNEYALFYSSSIWPSADLGYLNHLIEQKKATSHLDDRRRRLLRVHAAQTRRSHIGRYVMQTVQIET